MATYRLSTSEECRRIFNEQEYSERLQRGEFTDRIVGQGRKKRKGALRGWRSQTVAYYDGQRRVALVHQYVNDRGRIRGEPDPLTVYHRGFLYDCSHEHR